MTAETSGNATMAKPRQDEDWGAQGCSHTPPGSLSSAGRLGFLAAGVPRGAEGPADLKCPVTSRPAGPGCP